MRAIWIAAVAAIAVALVGCAAATTSPTPTKSPAAQVSPTQSTSTWGPAGIGDTVDMECSDPALHLRVTLLGVKRMAPALGLGSQTRSALYGLHLSVCNAAAVVYDGLIGRGCQLISASGRTIRQDAAVVGHTGATVLQHNEVKLGPGDTRSGWVWFDLKASLKPSKLRLTLSRRSSSGWSMILGEWQL